MPDAVLEEAFLDERPRLFQLAYRLMGTVADAEDALQDVFVRLRSAEPREVASPAPYLTRAVVRRCLDGWKSARSRRERYVGAWLPEPLAPGRDEPARREELADSISLAFLVVLEALDPFERAVFLLHDVFKYSFDEIAAIIGKTPAACRQIASRARPKVAGRRPRFPTSPEQHRLLVERFLGACQTGDLASLREILADDITVYSDGGGLTPAARVPLKGIDRVGRFLLGLYNKSRRMETAVRLELAEINRAAAILQYVDGRLHAVLSFESDAGRIVRIFSVLNPQKLAAFVGERDGGF